MDPDARSNEGSRQVGSTFDARLRTDAYDAGRGQVILKTIAFVWVAVNVYLVAFRLSLLGVVPIGFGMAFLVVILSTWAALDGKRWGWISMTMLAAVSIADFALASGVIVIAGVRAGRTWSVIAHQWVYQLDWLGLGPAFGAIVVCVWFASLALLLSRPVRLQVFANKRAVLRHAQAVIAICLLLAYLMGVLSVGATSRAIRLYGVASQRSRGLAAPRNRQSPLTFEAA